MEGRGGGRGEGEGRRTGGGGRGGGRGQGQGRRAGREWGKEWWRGGIVTCAVTGGVSVISVYRHRRKASPSPPVPTFVYNRIRIVSGVHRGTAERLLLVCVCVCVCM